jgi:hypothetical protein
VPIKIPSLDDRKYQELLNEALARIPVHNPEWTNFNKSDPGVTLIEVFAFLTENLLYRANQVPERNRRKFLSLLGVPIQAATPSSGLVTFSNERGLLASFTLNRGMEVRAGQIPYRTDIGLDVLPIEARVYYKRPITNLSAQQKEYYRQLYASFLSESQPDLDALQLYETVAMPEPGPGSTGLDLGSSSVVDGIWIALFVRASDKPAKAGDPYDDTLDSARKVIAGKTLSLGVVPYLPDGSRLRNPVGQTAPDAATRLQFETPNGRSLAANREPVYISLPAEASTEVLTNPGIVQVTLPAGDHLRLWDNIEPLEQGVGEFPPSLEDTNLKERLITWIHITAPPGVPARLYWLGINTTSMTQGAVISHEHLPKGTGEPDQAIRLGHKPVISGSLKIHVTSNGQEEEIWREIDDLLSAGPEVSVPDLRLPPGSQSALAGPNQVFQLDAEAGEIQFGDGIHGKRPPREAAIFAEYIYSVGAQGNIGSGSVNSAPALPAGIKVSNPVPTWGGTDSETQPEAEKQIPRYLQHRDRLVTVDDFETITWRTPGADVGRVEVIPAYHPRYSLAPGDTPGMVTLMLIPSQDPNYPDAPRPDQNFLEAVCTYLDPRRLVTTELYLTGPSYVPIWVSVGIQVLPGISIAETRNQVKTAIQQFLSPLPPDRGHMPIDNTSTGFASGPKGWPLGKPVVDLELATVASRVPGVMAVKDVLIAKVNSKPPVNGRIPMSGLELPCLAGVSVAIGDPLSMAQIGNASPSDNVPDQSGQTGQTGPGTPPGPRSLPIPIIPEECK